jgi:hypothetical protein
MRLYNIVFTGFLIFVVINLKAQTVVSVRDMFYRASKSSASADSLYTSFNTINTLDNAFTIAYKGMSQLMICYHSYNPYTKFKYFVKGKESLEQAIKKDPRNIEYRFLRLSVQLNTPEFLGYNSNIKEDKLAIFNGVKTLTDKDLLERIANYTSNAKRLTTLEKEEVKKALMVNKNYMF